MTENHKAVAFFNTAYKTFQTARAAMNTSVERFYSIGGYTIRLRFAGPALVPLLTPALEHLAAKHDEASSLTVNLWDNESTQFIMPPPPWSLDDYSAGGEVPDYSDDRVSTACHKGSGALSVLDRRTDSAVWWISRASVVPFYEIGAPLLTILHWWTQGRGLQLLHAAAVGTSEAGVLLVGKGGSGKSTAALACLESDLFYAGDDYCLVRVVPDPYVLSLYCSGKLDTDQLDSFKYLASSISNKDRLKGEKALFLLNKHFPDKIIKGFPIRAIFVLNITRRPETTLTASSSGTALRAIAPNTLFQLARSKHSTLHEMASLTRQVPCYQLNVGTELNGIAEVILKFICHG